MIEVLIVDDDPMVSEINKSYLEQVDGYHLKGTASSVKEAIRFIEKNTVKLILLDIFMPETEGIQLLIKIREMQKDIDVILITAASDMRTIHKAFQFGAVDYIIKPFRFDRFEEALIKYKKQTNLLLNDSKLSQEELDHLLLKKQEKAVQEMLPKGLSKNTLREIWNYIEQKKGLDFTTEELVNTIGISRISIRKYLSFLEKIDVISSYCSYGNVGRPLTMFRSRQESARNIEPYIGDQRK
ncbi:response regulator [Bacillus sp. AGMB 02131]|uniref:Response regulator n=1 Tax=Peribacillus faecalis TaxID=2772559 RepID=A0A927H9N6_9BACI|nr:response regulator [Peribacillus faecalis]MBD3107079.1 response regulator [Peribacillus faecalis]